MKNRNTTIIFVVCLLIVAAVSAIISIQVLNSNKEALSEKDELSEAQTLKNEYIQKAKNYVENMTLDEKIGQMFYLDLEGLETGYRSGKYFPTSISDSQIENLKKYKIGGIIYFAKNLTDKTALIKYNYNLQTASKIPLFIGTDEEGGDISRLTEQGNLGVRRFPDMRVIGDTHNPIQAYNVGRTLAVQMLMLGFNMDFAPVADIDTNDKNPVIGKRAFGTTPDAVSDMVANEVQGFQEQNMSSVLKHFPGHGDTNTDTHTGSAATNANLKRLQNVEFKPFEAGIKAGADFVLTAHILLPNATDDNLPATMSKEIIINQLRDKLKFSGIVITDALDMDAISQNYTNDQIAFNCVNAGVDILLMPKDFYGVYNSLKKYVEDGLISEERINESVIRIITTKFERGLLK
ncbi:MAG: glycoside hydrolase family 3 protein [Bifidobacteriaceae bacterium]|jgi:beta-N-acetylhexosaminidase|nr:glycoside hydrolase family 3 protein [Bifidobacteriaceae bacterium]